MKIIVNKLEFFKLVAKNKFKINKKLIENFFNMIENNALRNGFILCKLESNKPITKDLHAKLKCKFYY